MALGGKKPHYSIFEYGITEYDISKDYSGQTNQLLRNPTVLLIESF